MYNVYVHDHKVNIFISVNGVDVPSDVVVVAVTVVDVAVEGIVVLCAGTNTETMFDISPMLPDLKIHSEIKFVPSDFFYQKKSF